MKFWQKKKTFDVSETDQVHKVIYLGNVITTWAKGEHTLEKPLTVLWRNYCKNYANFSVKNDNKKVKTVQNKQILMKLTVCNQGLKALTREFGLTEYWANRITFCGQHSNFPRVFAWIYRHEAKQKKQELRVHACFVNSQVNVNKMINTLQMKINFALNEFKREKRLRENARKVFTMNESFNLDEVDNFKPDKKILNNFVDDLYAKINKNEKKDDESSINSSEKIRLYESTNTSKNSTLDSKKISRNHSQSSLNSLKSKSSTSSKKSLNYDNNLMPIRRQFLVKGLKNFKEPLERSRSAPKLGCILEEYSSDEDLDEEDSYFDKIINNNFVNFYSICEEEPDDEEIIRELELISNSSDSQKLYNFTGSKENLNFEIDLDKEKDYENISVQTNSDETNSDNKSDLDQTIRDNNCDLDQTICENNCDLNKTVCENNFDQTISKNKYELDETICKNNCDQLICSKTNDDKIFKDEDIAWIIERGNPENIFNNIEKSLIKLNDDKEINLKNNKNQFKENCLYSTCQSPQFIIVGEKVKNYKDKNNLKNNSFENKILTSDLHAKQIIDNCKLIEDLVLNF